MTEHLQDIAVNELPSWSSWPARLIGTETFKAVERNLEKIHSEYSLDKWQKCLDAFEASNGSMTPDDLRRFYYDLSSTKLRASVKDGRLLAATNGDVMGWYDEKLTAAIAPFMASAKTLVELGSSFGHIMWMLRKSFPNVAFRGGDFADSAVALASKLYALHPGVSVQKFDFYADRYDLLEQAEGPVVVITSQALEQVPKSAGVVEALSRYRGKIACVVHLEPAYSLYDDGTLLGLMRRRYIEVNDYNRDLIPTLQSRKDVEILRLEPHSVGWNPFNSLALVVWRFKR